MVVRRKRERFHRAATVTQAQASVNGKCAQIAQGIWPPPLVDLLETSAS
jgi:hypothetical protein